jgi:hypothetical protein
LHISKSYSARANEWGANRDSLIKWRDKIHYNCIRLCELDARAIMDGRPASAFATVEESFPLVDAVINNADSLGLYVVLNYHCPMPNDHCNCAWDQRNFWRIYAPRYKDRTHVLYELYNEGNGTPDPSNLWAEPGVLEMVNIVRSAAPNTMIIHGSGAILPPEYTNTLPPYLRDTYAKKAGFTWNDGKNAFGFHAYYPCEVDGIRNLQAAGIPLFMTEFTFPENYPQCTTAQLEGNKYPSQWCEKNGIAWMDWVLWNQANQGQPRIDYLIPDAVSKGYAWWTGSAISNAPNPATPTQSLNSIVERGGDVLANGRVRKDIGRMDEGYRLSILPRSIEQERK